MQSQMNLSEREIKNHMMNSNMSTTNKKAGNFRVNITMSN